MSEDTGPKKTISDFEAKLSQADAAVAKFEQGDRTPVTLFREFLRAYPTAIPAGVLVLSVVAFGLFAHNFMKFGTLSLVLQQVTVTGIVAIAQTMIILTAGIDLSVGQILVVCSLVMGKLAVEAGVPVVIAILLGFVAGGLMGCLNGALVAFWRLPPFIVTLGTLGIFKTLKLWYSGSESVRASDIEDKASFLDFFGIDLKLGAGAEVTLGGVALVLLAIGAWYVLNRTPWGRHVHAVGDDPDAALLAGIQTNRVIVSVYTVAGLVCAFGAWISIGRVGTINPESFDQINLDSITATVIGGTSLFGGRGSIVGSVLGALIVGVFSTGLSLAGVDSYWQYLTIGMLIIVAVAIDQWLRRATQ